MPDLSNCEDLYYTTSVPDLSKYKNLYNRIHEELNYAIIKFYPDQETRNRENAVKMLNETVAALNHPEFYRICAFAIMRDKSDVANDPNQYDNFSDDVSEHTRLVENIWGSDLNLPPIIVPQTKLEAIC